MTIEQLLAQLELFYPVDCIHNCLQVMIRISSLFWHVYIYTRIHVSLGHHTTGKHHNLVEAKAHVSQIIKHVIFENNNLVIKGCKSWKYLIKNILSKAIS